MDDEELARALAFEYYGIAEDNPDWDMSYYDFLRSRGFSRKQLDEMEITPETEGVELQLR